MLQCNDFTPTSLSNAKVLDFLGCKFTTPIEFYQLDHSDYQAAVFLRRQQLISDAELVLIALLVNLTSIYNLDPNRLFQAKSALVKNVPLIKQIPYLKIRYFRADAAQALSGWHLGLFPGVLYFGKSPLLDLLKIQSQGKRFVGIAFDKSDVSDDSYNGGFIHHDLCHLAKFRGLLSGTDRDYYYLCQVGFFHVILQNLKDWLAVKLITLEPQAVAGPLNDVVTDMNGDVNFLLNALMVRTLKHLQTNELANSRGDAIFLTLTMLFPKLSAPTLHRLVALFDENRGLFFSECQTIFFEQGRSIINL